MKTMPPSYQSAIKNNDAFFGHHLSLNGLRRAPPTHAHHSSSSSITTTTITTTQQLQQQSLYDAELEHNRNLQNSLNRLKNGWEGIIQRFEKSFDGEGDEIDLETGEVVVDNGHLRGLKDDNQGYYDVGNWLVESDDEGDPSSSATPGEEEAEEIDAPDDELEAEETRQMESNDIVSATKLDAPTLVPLIEEEIITAPDKEQEKEVEGSDAKSNEVPVTEKMEDVPTIFTEKETNTTAQQQQQRHDQQEIKPAEDSSTNNEVSLLDQTPPQSEGLESVVTDLLPTPSDEGSEKENSVAITSKSQSFGQTSNTSSQPKLAEKLVLTQKSALQTSKQSAPLTIKLRMRLKIPTAKETPKEVEPEVEIEEPQPDLIDTSDREQELPKQKPPTSQPNMWAISSDDPFYDPNWQDQHPDGEPPAEMFPPPPKPYISVIAPQTPKKRSKSGNFAASKRTKIDDDAPYRVSTPRSGMYLQYMKKRLSLNKQTPEKAVVGNVGPATPRNNAEGSVSEDALSVTCEKFEDSDDEDFDLSLLFQTPAKQEKKKRKSMDEVGIFSQLSTKENTELFIDTSMEDAPSSVPQAQPKCGDAGYRCDKVFCFNCIED